MTGTLTVPRCVNPEPGWTPERQPAVVGAAPFVEPAVDAREASFVDPGVARGPTLPFGVLHEDEDEPTTHNEKDAGGPA